MKIVMVMKWDGVTADQYEQVRETVNWEGDKPDGAIFHVSGFDNNSLRVTDIWESADHFNHFVQSRLMPGTAAAGVTSAPVVEIFPVHAIYAPAPHSLI
jgi:hypothetical protein